MKRGGMLAAWLFAVMTLVAGAWAQDYPAGPNGEAAPVSSGPQPDVARISLMHGDVSMQRGDTGDWAATTVNAPLVGGDQIATGEKSRAEIQLDYADIVRLAAKSQVKIADLTRTRIQIQVAQGYASFTQLKGSEADVEIDTPNVAVRPLKHGRYRVQVNSESETDVIVREGEAEITTPQGSTTVKEGEIITVRGTDNPEYKVAGAPGKDDWDRWNKDRDNVIKDAQSWGRTNRYYTGVNDLDAYGQWVFVPGYGWVWRPYSANVGWAPYQSGRWVWEPYYGWTWVSYEPWGWAPYHYGRWFFYGGNWCWWPGPVFVGYRPVWSPAFVFFVGFGHHSGFGFGNIGWFPVGPHDPFYPWWGRGFNRVNVVNITNITVINERRGGFIAPLATRGRQPYYSNVRLLQTNARVRGSITSVGVEDFGHGNFANRQHGINEHELHDARVMTANLPVVPSRENLRVAANANAGVGATVQPRNVDRFYTRHQPPAPESFHTQVERVQRAVGPDAVNSHASVGERGNMEVPRVNGSANAGATAGNQTRSEGSGRFGKTEAGNAAAAGNEGGKESSPAGYRRFGNSGPNNAGIGPGSKSTTTESTGQTTSGGKLAQSTPPANGGANNSGGNSAQDKSQNDRGGWRTFGSRRSGGAETGNTGRSEQTPAPSIKNDQGGVPHTNNSSGPNRGSENPNREKFPSAGEGRTSQPDKQPPQTEDRGGWQHFPSNGGGGSRSNDSSTSKPPLELHRPIVTPRTDSHDTRNDTRSGSGSSREQPRYTPPQRSEPRSSPPSRSESPRYSPPSRSESRGSHDGGSSSSSHGGSSDRGGHSDSKSSSNPKH